MAQVFRWKGPSLKKIMRTLEKKNIEMVKGPLRESTKLAQKEAKRIAPVLTGRYRRAIRMRVKVNRRRGSIIGKAGIPNGHEVFLYAGKVESKYFVFTQVEKTQAGVVRREFNQGIRKYFNTLKIR